MENHNNTQPYVPNQDGGDENFSMTSSDHPPTQPGRKQIKESIFDRISFWSIIALSVLTPLFFIPSLLVPLPVVKAAFFGVGMFVATFFWLLARMRDGTIVFPAKSIFSTILFLLVLLLASSVFAENSTVAFFGRGLSIDSLLYITLFALFAFLVAYYFKTKTRIGIFFIAILASALVLYIYHILRFMFGPDTLGFGIFLSSIATPVAGWYNLAIFSGFITVLALCAYELMPLSRPVKYISVGILALSFFFLMVINFSLVWIMLAVSALLLFAYSMTLFMTERKETEEEAETSTARFPTLSLFAFLVAVFFALGGSGSVNMVSSSLQSVTGVQSVQEVRPSWKSTILVAKDTMSESYNNILFGSGLGSFSTQWAQHRPEGTRITQWWNVDFDRGVGYIPTMITTTGIVGLLAWGVFLFIIFWAGLRGISRVREKGKNNAAWVYALVIMQVYLWAFLIWYIPNISIFIFTFAGVGILASVLVSQGVVQVKTYRFLDNPRLGFAAVLFLILALAGTIFGGYTIAQKYRAVESYYASLVTSQTGGNLDTAERQIIRSIQLNPEDTYFRAMSSLQRVRMRQVLAQSDASTPEEVTHTLQNTFTSALQFSKAATNFASNSHLNWISVGDTYAAFVPLRVDQAYENAKKAYDTALELSPNNPLIYLKFAELEASNGNTVVAESYISQALETKSNFAEAYMLRSGLLLQQDNRTAEAIQALEAASLIVGNNSNLWFQLGYLKYTADDFKGAVTAFERAVILNPFFSNAKYFLGLSYYEVGRNSDAIAQFKDVASLNPDNEEVKRIISNLEAGKDPLEGFGGHTATALTDTVSDESELEEDEETDVSAEDVQ